ncbi:LOW QUALITY PROTEIN: hypothetical protein PanWU01x14_111380, partial [Parasponia andersonii]
WCCSPFCIIEDAELWLAKYKRSNFSQGADSVNASSSGSWSPPTHGCLKLNVSDTGNYIGVGVILRDSLGLVCGAAWRTIQRMQAQLFTIVILCLWKVSLWMILRPIIIC